MMGSIDAIVHVYRYRDNHYVVPLIQITGGPWLETVPVHEVPSDALDALAGALVASRAIAGKTVAEAKNAWETPIGARLAQASGLCVVRWYSEGIINVVPQQFEGIPTEDEESGGWRDISEARIQLPADQPVNRLAEVIRSFLTV